MGQILELAGSGGRPGPAGPPGSSGALTLVFTGSSGLVGQAYSAAFRGNGGTPPYTYALTSGTLPTSVTLNTSTGDLTGTPTSAASFTFTVTVTDNVSATATKTATVVINGQPTEPFDVVLSNIGQVFQTSDQTTYAIIQIDVDESLFTTLGTHISVQFSTDGGTTFGTIAELDSTSSPTYAFIYRRTTTTYNVLQLTTTQSLVARAWSSNAYADPGPVPTALTTSTPLSLGPIGVPSATAPTLHVTAPAQSVDKTTGLIVALLHIVIDTPGTADPNCWFYQPTILNTDSSGTAGGSVGGRSNVETPYTPGIPNDGLSHPFDLEIGYQVAGSTFTYVQIVVYAVSRTATISHSTNAWEDPTYSVPVHFPGGLAYTRQNYGAIPAGAIPANRLDPSTLAGSLTNNNNGQLALNTSNIGNIVLNGDFANGMTGWTGTGADTTDPGFSDFLAPVLRLTPDITGLADALQPFSCTPADVFWGRITTRALISDSSIIVFAALWYDKNGSQIGGTDFTGGVGSCSTTTFQISRLFTAPAGAFKLSLLVYCQSATFGTQKWFVDNVLLRPQISGLAIKYGAAVVDDGTGAITIATAGPLYKDISGLLNMHIASDFVVSGGVLTQNAIDLAKAYHFDTTDFQVSGGSLAVKTIAVNKLIAGTALFAGTATFAYTATGAYVQVGSSGLVIADNFTSPTCSFTASSAGFSLIKGGNRLDVQASQVALYGPISSLIFTSGGVVLTDGTHSVTVSSAGVAVVGGTLSNTSGPITLSIDMTNYMQVIHSGSNIWTQQQFSNFRVQRASDAFYFGQLGLGNLTLTDSGGSHTTQLTAIAFEMQGLPSSDPGAGSKQFWYDPFDGNRVKFSA